MMLPSKGRGFFGHLEFPAQTGGSLRFHVEKRRLDSNHPNLTGALKRSPDRQ